MELVLNDPPDVDGLAALLSDKDDLLLVWPEAKFPFDREQWRQRLSLLPGNRSYFVTRDGETIGHVALLETEEAKTLDVSFVFVKPQHRGRGLGTQLMELVEREAMMLGARALRLRVRTYNPRARRVYEAVGFVPASKPIRSSSCASSSANSKPHGIGSEGDYKPGGSARLPLCRYSAT